MTRVRLSTTVDEGLLQAARVASAADSDASLIDGALRAFLASKRAAEIDSSYAAYDNHPLDEVDDWGDLESFREAAAAS
jgi:hypothetical protein